MRYFRKTPSFAYFWVLYSINSSSKTGEQCFFYLTPKPRCKIMDKLSFSLNPWKDKYVFIQAPYNHPWNVPSDWRIARPRPRNLGPVEWDEDFVSSRLTQNWFNAPLLLTEEVLVLANLSPAPLQSKQSLGNSSSLCPRILLRLLHLLFLFFIFKF